MNRPLLPQNLTAIKSCVHIGKYGNYYNNMAHEETCRTRFDISDAKPTLSFSLPTCHTLTLGQDPSVSLFNAQGTPSG